MNAPSRSTWWRGLLGLLDPHAPQVPAPGSVVTSSIGTHSTSVAHDPALGRLLVQRASDLDDGWGRWPVLVDGHQVARVRHHEETWVPLPPGRHVVTAGHWGECAPVPVDLTAGETVALVLGLASPLWLSGSPLLRPPPPRLALTRTS